MTPTSDAGARPLSAAADQAPALPWTPARLVAAFLFLILGVAAAYSPWSDILSIAYQDEEQSHVFLVLPFAAVLLFLNRERLPLCAGPTSYAGPLLVGIGWAVCHVGYNNAIQSFWHGGGLLIALGCVLSVLGTGVVRQYWPILLMLAFLVPVPAQIRHPIALKLQTVMARITEVIFAFFGADIGRSGNLLTINGRSVAIAEACNGMRMVFTLVLVSYLFCFAVPIRHWVRWLIILISPLTAIVCNVIRLIPTLWFYAYGSQATADHFHDIAGWLMVPIAFVFLLGFIKLLGALGLPVEEERTPDPVVQLT